MNVARIRTKAVLVTARPRQNARLALPLLSCEPLATRRSMACHTRAGGGISAAAWARGVMRFSHSATICRNPGS
ncbi:hypothetical protein D3C83_50230 [compost metagenome]